MGNEDKENLLEEALISKDLWDYCYIAEDGCIYMPILNTDGEVLKTGEQYYLEQLNSVPIESKPTMEEQLEQSNKRSDLLEGENNKLKIGVADLAVQIAKNTLLK